jgi:hypothetical protein
MAHLLAWKSGNVSQADPKRKGGKAMRLTLTLCLIAGSAFSAVAQPKEAPPVFVTPFALLDEHPGCSGPGKNAYEVGFDVKDASARFGLVGQDKGSARTCTIKTRRGAETVEIPIPCPDVSSSDRAANDDLEDLPRAADISGKIIACIGLSEVSLLEGSWNIRVHAPDALEISGDLSSPDLIVLFDAPATQLSGPEMTTPQPTSPVLALIWDGVDASVQSMPGAALEISAYVALAPTDVPYKRCSESDCDPLFNTSMRQIVTGMGDQKIYEIVDFLEPW